MGKMMTNPSKNLLCSSRVEQGLMSSRNHPRSFHTDIKTIVVRLIANCSRVIVVSKASGTSQQHVRLFSQLRMDHVHVELVCFVILLLPGIIKTCTFSAGVRACQRRESLMRSTLVFWCS